MSESKAPSSGPPTSSRDVLIQGVLDELSTSPSAVVRDSLELAAARAYDHAALVGVIKSLAAEGYVTPPTVLKSKAYALTEEGTHVLREGSPEFHFYNALSRDGGSTEEELVAGGEISKDAIKNGKKNAMQKRWCAFDKDTKRFTRSVEAVTDTTQAELAHVVASDGVDTAFEGEQWSERKPGDTYKALKKRKFVTLVTKTSFACARGPNYSTRFVKPVADLTKEMLEGKSWQTANFKSYNFNSLGAPVVGGALHPLMKVRSEFRQVLLQMGFEEMPTNRFVESSFWNFDALFQPQQHPARDAHDTFFLTQPAAALKIPADYMATVKDTHQTGGPVKGSIGYRYDWKEAEARKNVLRTHTTAISSQMLYRLGQVSFGVSVCKGYNLWGDAVLSLLLSFLLFFDKVKLSSLLSTHIRACRLVNPVKSLRRKNTFLSIASSETRRWMRPTWLSSIRLRALWLTVDWASVTSRASFMPSS